MNILIMKMNIFERVLSESNIEQICVLSESNIEQICERINNNIL